MYLSIDKVYFTVCYWVLLGLFRVCWVVLGISALST